MMETLPRELLSLIFHYLPYNTLGTFRRTCRMIRDSLEDKYFLTQYYQEHIIRKKHEIKELTFIRVHHAIFFQHRIKILHSILSQCPQIKIMNFSPYRVAIRFIPSMVAIQESYLHWITPIKEGLMLLLASKGWKLVVEEDNTLLYTHEWWNVSSMMKLVYN